MQQPTKNSLSVLGVLVALSSLWLTWVIFEGYPVQSAKLDLQQSLMGFSGPTTYSGRATGFAGSILYVPIWVVVMLILTSHITQLMDSTAFFYVPKLIKWITLVAAMFFPVFSIIYPLFYQGITPGLGPYISFMSTAIAFATLAIPTSLANGDAEQIG